jgi:PTH1 family peptidyl-tRNA hydrolase
MGLFSMVVVGLGNPGPKYARTRHNLGFDVVDKLCELSSETTAGQSKFRALVNEAAVSEHRLLLVKPQTFMNRSGESVRDILAFYKMDPENLLVICDDLDLNLGQLRIRKKGGSGGHKGLQSIIYLLATENFPRLRIGIGHPPNGMVEEYVLECPDMKERVVLDEAVEKASRAVVSILQDGIDHAMNSFHQPTEGG